MSLQFNVSQLLKSDVGQTRTYGFESDAPLDLGEWTASDVRGNVKFTLTNFGVLAAIKGGAVLHLTCSRCLEPFQKSIDVAFDEEYVPSIDIATGLPSTTPRSDMALPISPNHMIDLEEAMRQQLLLAVDLIPVCRENCKGLCPTCGVNLNNETCACPPVEESGPFEALQDLFQASEAES